MNSRHTRILVVIDLGTIPGRNHFRGLLDYAAQKPDWQLVISEPGAKFDLNKLHELQNDGLDGAVVTLPGTAEAMRALAESDLPTVFANIPDLKLPHGRRRVSFVYSDNAAVGQLAAEHLLSLCTFKSFGFLNSPDRVFWAQECKWAFRDAVRGQAPFIDLNPNALADDLRALPKPAALMAAYYADAERIVATCAKLGIAIPDEVSLLCLNNESAVSRTGNAITSIESDMQGLGYHEGAELDRLLRTPPSRATTAREVVLPPKGLVVRASTTLDQHALTIVQAIDRFIADNFAQNISVNDITRELGCSRRLAEMRYREIKHLSIRQALERIRLQNAQQLRTASSASASAIARQCGFRTRELLALAIRKQTGLTLRDWLCQRNHLPAAS